MGGSAQQSAQPPSSPDFGVDTPGTFNAMEQGAGLPNGSGFGPLPTPSSQTNNFAFPGAGGNPLSFANQVQQDPMGFASQTSQNPMNLINQAQQFAMSFLPQGAQQQPSMGPDFGVDTSGTINAMEQGAGLPNGSGFGPPQTQPQPQQSPFSGLFLGNQSPLSSQFSSQNQQNPNLSMLGQGMLNVLGR